VVGATLAIITKPIINRIEKALRAAGLMATTPLTPEIVRTILEDELKIDDRKIATGILSNKNKYTDNQKATLATILQRTSIAREATADERKLFGQEAKTIREAKEAKKVQRAAKKEATELSAEDRALQDKRGAQLAREIVDEERRDRQDTNIGPTTTIVRLTTNPSDDRRNPSDDRRNRSGRKKRNRLLRVASQAQKAELDANEARLSMLLAEAQQEETTNPSDDRRNPAIAGRLTTNHPSSEWNVASPPEYQEPQIAGGIILRQSGNEARIRARLRHLVERAREHAPSSAAVVGATSGIMMDRLMTYLQENGITPTPEEMEAISAIPPHVVARYLDSRNEARADASDTTRHTPTTLSGVTETKLEVPATATAPAAIAKQLDQQTSGNNVWQPKAISPGTNIFDESKQERYAEDLEYVMFNYIEPTSEGASGTVDTNPLKASQARADGIRYSESGVYVPYMLWNQVNDTTEMTEKRFKKMALGPVRLPDMIFEDQDNETTFAEEATHQFPNGENTAIGFLSPYADYSNVDNFWSLNEQSMLYTINA
jgi:hypothetical protein